MSPTTLKPHEILTDDNYFLWEFNARMALARKELLDHVAIKPEASMEQDSAGWKVADMKALAVIVKMLSPSYQSMVRDVKTAAEAWFKLRDFFVKRNLHNRVQLRKHLHEFQMSPGDSLMDHFTQFDDICMKLEAVGDEVKEDERLAILLGSLSSDYDAMVEIIESRDNVDLHEAKEMLRREYDSMQRQEKSEGAFRAFVTGGRGRGRGHASGSRFERSRGAAGGRSTFGGRHGVVGTVAGRSMAVGEARQRRSYGQGSQRRGIQCFECGQPGHKRNMCPLLKRDSEPNHFSVMFRGHEVAVCKRIGKLYVLPVAPRYEDVVMSAAEDELKLWHARLGHASNDRLSTISEVANGVPSIKASDNVPGVCEGCACGKLCVAKHARTSGSIVKTNGPLEIVHSYIMGPMETMTKGGARYSLIFVDDWSRYVSVYLLKKKSETFNKFKEYKRFMEGQLGRRLRCLRTDNGGEFCSNKFNDYCNQNGVARQTSAPYSPEQNGLAERTNRSVAEMARSMLYYQHLPKEWWGEALVTAAYTINRLPNTARRDITPYEQLWKTKPSLKHVRVFGSRGFVYVDSEKRSKWDAKAHKCIFLGYSETAKAYRVWDMEDQRVVMSRTVALDERPPSDVVNMTPQVLLMSDYPVDDDEWDEGGVG